MNPLNSPSGYHKPVTGSLNLVATVIIQKNSFSTSLIIKNNINLNKNNVSLKERLKKNILVLGNSFDKKIKSLLPNELVLQKKLKTLKKINLICMLFY